MIEEWRADDAVFYFTQFLSSFRVVFWLQKLSWDIYLIIFYICIFIVFVIILDFLYVSISYRHKRLASLVINLNIEFFLSLSACAKDSSSGEMRHLIFTTEVCFQSIHILHITLSYIMIIIFCVMAMIAVIMQYENRFTKDPTSKINARTDILLLLSKTLYVLFFTLFSQKDFAIFKSIILAVFSTIVIISYLTNKPYFNHKSQLVQEMFAGVFAWTNYVLVFSQIVSGSQYNGALEILFMGIPIICALIYTKSEYRMSMLLVPETMFQKGEQVLQKIVFYLQIVEARESDRQASIVLKGYVNHHCEVCPFDTCPIKAFKRLMMREKLASERDKKKRQLAKGALNQNENNSLLLQQAKALFNNGIRKFPKYTMLRIDYANFLQSKLKDRKGALNELAFAEKQRPSLAQQFQIFRQRKIIEDELSEGQDHGGIDFIAAMNYEAQFKNFKQMIQKCALLHYELWNNLLDDSPDLVRLSQQGAKINAAILEVDEQWKKLAKMNNNTPKALKLYASYIIEILNDKETGNEQMMKAKEAANLRVNFEFKNVNDDFSDLSNYAQDGTPCIYVSGEQERLGIVNQCNMSLCKIFGYMKKDDIVNKDCDLLMPSIYRNSHKEFLNLSVQKSADQISNRERQVFGKHVSGYIFPIWLQIKNLSNMLSGRQYVATFKVEKTGINKNVAHIILNTEKEIMDVSSSCFTMLGISNDTLTKKQVKFDLPSLFPQLFVGNAQQYSNKAGSLINYYYPQLINFVDNQQKDGDDRDKEGKRDGQTESVNDQEDKTNDDAQDDQISVFHSVNIKLKSSKNVNDKGPSTQEDSAENTMKEEDIDNAGTNYTFKAIGNPDRMTTYLCNFNEIFFEMIQLHAGYHLRLESAQENNNAGHLNKQLFSNAFQFSYDHIFKRFTRELRDKENNNCLLDNNFIDLKKQKELAKLDTPEGVQARTYQTMTYVSYLNHQQRIIEKGVDAPDSEGEDNQSESDSNASNKEHDDKKNNNNNDKNNVTTKNGEQGVQQKDSKGMKEPMQQPALEKIQESAYSDFNKLLVAGEGFGKDFLKSEIERLIKILQEKQNIGKEIHTFIRLDGPRKGWEEDNTQKAGLFIDRANELQKLEEKEDENVEEKTKDKESDGDQLKANIKSKKAFSMAINDKTMPPAIKRLSFTAQFIILFLIAIATVDYAIMYQLFQDIKTNFILLDDAYLRSAEFQKVAYNGRTMILMSVGWLKNYGKYQTAAQYAAYIKQDFANSLDLIYKLQNEINLSQLPVSPPHDQLLNNKTVTLYFKQDETSTKALQFSLTEAILQLSSTIFTLSNLQLSAFNESNEDVFFLMYNVFNEFYTAMRQSSSYYNTELDDRINSKTEIGLIIFLLSIGALVICFIILIPVVHTVNKQKDKVLTLFCDIDNSIIQMLAQKCEKFMNMMQAEEANDEVESNEEVQEEIQTEDQDDEYNLLSGGKKRNKKAKGNTKTDKKFFVKFIFSLLCVNAYFLQNYILQTNAVTTAHVLNGNINIVCQTERYYWLYLNNQREMIYNPSRPITQKSSIDIAKQASVNLFNQNTKLQNGHLTDQDYLDTVFWQRFEDVMRKDLCEQLTYFESYDKCASFISGTLTQGLHPTQIRYFETLRNQLNNYATYNQSKNATAIKEMLNLDDFYQLCIFIQLKSIPIDVIQNFVNLKFMRELVQQFSDSIQTEFSFRAERKLALFIVFVIAILIGFVAIWLPFLNGLNFQIYKTKLMLMIIPLEVLMKIKNVAKVLKSQSFITENKKKSRKQNTAQSA